MKRRSFLKASSLGIVGAVSSISGLISWSPRAYAATINKTYYITDGQIPQADGTNVYFKGFSSSSGSLNVPGESLIVQQGDTVNVTIVNTLNTTHSFVIDGVVNSGSISGGSTSTVSFTANQAGSFMFYDERNAPYNRVIGLHGGFAVMPQGSTDELYSGSPTFKKQLFWILNEVDPAWNARVQNGQTPNTAFVPRYFTINGLSARPPGAPEYSDPNRDSGYDPRTKLSGYIGDRTLIRCLNAGMCSHSLHWHANHLEYLTKNGQVRNSVWLKDIIGVDNDMGQFDAIYPFEPPPDAYPSVTTGKYVMHLHDEMTQTAGGGLYQFGAATGIEFK